MLSVLVVQVASMPSYSSVMANPGSGSFMEHCGGATAHARAVAPQHSSQQCTPAQPCDLCDVYSMLMHGLCRVVGQSEAVASTDTTPKDLFDRTLYVWAM